MEMVESKEMEARLRAFYATHNPGNEQNIAEIVSKYRGKEAVLCAKLRKKYGVAPDLAAPPATSTRSMPVPAYDAAFTPFCAPPSRADDPLDFRSPAFDALQALSAGSLRPLVSDGVFPLDNIHKCRRLLPASDPHHQSTVLGTAQASDKRRQQQQQATKPAKSDASAAPKPTLFETLADTYLDGPFTVLRRCFLERKRVRVVVRRVNSVRGVCAGFLKAFDKHMNLVLLDVTEIVIPHGIYERRDRAAAQQEPVELFSVADDARNRTFTVKQYSKQLFVRGDNIVMVMADPTPGASARGQRATSTAPSAAR
ncbi:hypothetical protein P43SY_002859 [Pythium insidiosum]|uniref:Sm domain-containing protein n=1 Tax=Pythium insidiosum TaxID=114742 RepID=A0AAD5LPU8_PYTIN|nr:hypothetical protein P43SY_002859 [Pythium insidiosum]